MSDLTFDAYQDATDSTAIYPADKALEYTVLGITSEVGEVAGKLKKVMRDNDSVVTLEKASEIGDELADVLWYAARIAKHLGFSLGDLAQRNLDKLESRKARGVIGGSGDNR